ncbi:hypothetical protein [Streptomyces yanii]|uniref:Uncharacterized protein n=1 Tax=Streptomyces yanii TaxID=78510 RepID=A0ABV5RMP1_9ACTN
MRAGVEIAVWCAVLLGVTVVFISSVSPVELLVAGLAAVGGAFAARRMRLAAGGGIQSGRGSVCAAVLVPRAILRGLVLLVTTMAEQPQEATVRRVRLKPGCAAGWAGVLIATSPDTCVIDVPHDDEVLVHALRPEAGPVEDAVTRPRGGR